MNKNLIIITAILLLTFKQSLAQDAANLFADNNPQLTKAESKWLNEKFTSKNFDFENKYIGFIELLSGGFYGIGKFTLPFKKKNITQLDLKKNQHQLIILDSAQKTMTRGFDALLVFVNKKNERKLQRLNIEKLIFKTKNRYPQISPDAGLYNNTTLNRANAFFFNELYKADFYPKTDFDFNGKKVAILNTNYQSYKIEFVNIADYVQRIKSQLDSDGFSMTDLSFYLNADQKKQSGGYDVIIQFHCKKSLPMQNLIRFLKQNGT